MAFKRGTRVEIFWTDADSSVGWESIKDVFTKAQKVRSLGYVIHDNEDAIVLAGDVTQVNPIPDDDTVNRTIAIPKGMVQKVRRIP